MTNNRLTKNKISAWWNASAFKCSQSRSSKNYFYLNFAKPANELFWCHTFHFTVLWPQLWILLLEFLCLREHKARIIINVAYCVRLRISLVPILRRPIPCINIAVLLFHPSIYCHLCLVLVDRCTVECQCRNASVHIVSMQHSIHFIDDVESVINNCRQQHVCHFCRNHRKLISSGDVLIIVNIILIIMTTYTPL